MAAPTTPAPTTTVPHIDSAVETSFQQLLRMYQKTIYAQEAYNKFVGATTDEALYYRNQSDIQLATIHKPLINNGNGIINLGQAKAALGPTTNYLNNRTKFRTIGLLTGIDPEHLGEPFSLNARQNGFFDFKEKNEADDLLYNTGVGKVKQPDTKLEYAFVQKANAGESESSASGVIGFGPYQFIGDTAILQYLANKAYLRDQAGQPTTPPTTPLPAITGNPYKDLALLLATDAKNLISSYSSQLEARRTTGVFDSDADHALVSEIKMGKIIAQIEAIDGSVSVATGPGTPLLPLQDFSDSPIPGRSRNVWVNAQALSYANTQTNHNMAVLHQWTVQLESQTQAYRDLLDQIIQLEGLVPTRLDHTKGVQMQVQEILAFFGAQEPIDPLPDAPEFATLVEAVKDKEARAALQEAIRNASSNLTPFDMQCYLMENIEEIVAQRNVPSSAMTPSYRHVKKLVSSGNPAMVTNILQHGTEGSPKSKRIEQLLNLCPEVYASLVPYIKIYRVDYDDDGSISIDPETNKPVEKELVIPNFIDPTDLGGILTGGRGRIPGAGIKSFSWSLVGVQPEEVDNNITAKLVVYFQSINDFFRGAAQAGGKEPNFLDLLINSPAVQKDLKEKESNSKNDEKTTVCDPMRDVAHRGYEGKNYRIKVVAGWSAPSNLLDLMPKADPTIVEKLAEALDASKVSLFLQQVRHALDFKDDGALEMSIDYQASIAGLLTSPRSDIFGADTAAHEDEIKDIDKEFERYKELGDQITEHQKKQKESLLEKKQKLKNEGRLRKYRKLLQGMFNSTSLKLHTIEVPAGELLMTPYRDLTSEKRAKRAKRKLNPTTGTLTFSSTANLQTDLVDSINKSTDDPTGETDAAKEYSLQATKRYNDIQNLRSKFVILPFFFLGDLIDNVVEQMKTNNAGKPVSFDMFLSDVEMINPLVAFQVKGLDDMLNCGNMRDLKIMETLMVSDPKTFSSANNIVNIMNIGDIPISTEAFQLFFKNKVVKKNRETYHFLFFMKELCAELITKALNKTCFGPDVSFQQRFDVRPLTYIQKPGGQPTSVSVKTLAEQCDILPSTPIGDTRQALILLPTDTRPSDLVGDYKKDTSMGIYHHYIGASCGLLKTLKFNREDQQYLRESKIQREGALGAEQLRELYSSTLELVGNNLYKNGMYIYINPTLLDASKTELDYLGLHGYYLVTGVQSSVTPQGFTTSMTALHEGIEFRPAKLSPEVWDVTAEKPPPDIVVIDPVKSARIYRENVMEGTEGNNAAGAEKMREATRALEAGEIGRPTWLISKAEGAMIWLAGGGPVGPDSDFIQFGPFGLWGPDDDE